MPINFPDLPDNIDATYADRSPGDAAHQQYHDAEHGAFKQINGAGGAATGDDLTAHLGATDPHGDRAYADGLTAHRGARVYHSAVQTLATAVTVTLAFDSEVHDDGGFHAAINNSRITAPEAGAYLVLAAVQFAANDTGLRQLSVLHNGATVALSNANAVATGGIPTRIQISTLLRLAVGDYVQLAAYQSSGSDVSITQGSNTTWFAATKLGT